MGVAITEIVSKDEVDIITLAHKVICIDASVFLYQFLSSIRSRDGTPLQDSKGNTTSHLVGLLSRISKMIGMGIKLVFVFDGTMPKLKAEERKRRALKKQEAELKYHSAVQKEDIEGMRKYAQQTTRLTTEIIEESKEFVKAFGIPIVTAPSEAEAQAAYMVAKGDAYAVASQDFDCLMFGAPRLIRNLSFSGRKKVAGKLSYETLKPEMITLAKVKEELKLSQDQMIVLSMLVGTDFNGGGIKGIGPKNALKKLGEYREDFTKLFKDLNWEEYFEYPWEEVFSTIKDIPTTDSYDLEWNNPDEEKIIKILVDDHEFSKERVETTLEQVRKATVKKQQKNLGDFF